MFTPNENHKFRFVSLNCSFNSSKSTILLFNMENQEEIYLNMEYRVEHGSINVDEEHQILSKEEIKSSLIVCYVSVTLTDIYPCPPDDFDNIHYCQTLSTYSGDVIWASYDQPIRDELYQPLLDLGVQQDYHPELLFKALDKEVYELLTDDDGDYVRSYMHGNTRKALRIYVNLIQLHEGYYDDTHCRLVPTAASAIDRLEKVKVEDLAAVTKRENCCICFEGQLLFHDRCIVEWLQSSHFCPLCHFEMPVDI